MKVGWGDRAVMLAAAAAGATQIRANDLWWHLAAGAWIADHATVPRTDPFSFTGAGTDWIDHAWLWQVAAWSVRSIASDAGLVLMKMACAVLLAGACLAALRRAEWGPHGRALMVLLCIAGSRFRLTDRPDTASLALLALFLGVLVAPDLRAGPRVIGAAAVCALWSNVHPGVLLAPALAAACAVASVIDGWRVRRGGGAEVRPVLRRAREEMLVAAASAVAIFVNPYGYRLVAVPLRISGALSDPRLINPEWLPPTFGTFPLFHVTAVAGLVICARRILRGHAPAWRELVLIAGASALALSSARHIGVFFTVLPFAAAAATRPAPPPAPQVPHDLFRRAEAAAPPSLAFGWGLLAAALFLIVPSPLAAPVGFGVERSRFPERETDYIERNLPPPRFLYNEVAHGGYLIWRFYPVDQVFIDGRNEVHAGLLRDIAGALDDGRAWSALLERHGIEAALVRYREQKIHIASRPTGEERSFATLHFPRRAWALVHWGDAGMVFVRRGPRHQSLIVRDEYRFIHPEDWEYQRTLCREGDQALREGILADLRRRAAEPARSERAADLLARFEALERE